MRCGVWCGVAWRGVAWRGLVRVVRLTLCPREDSRSRILGKKAPLASAFPVSWMKAASSAFSARLMSR